jgi:hypothetical protein
MARKDTTGAAPPRGFSDVIGIALIAGSLLLLVAQLSFDRYDIDSNRVPPNQSTHNLIGSAGAFGANVLFRLFGGGAFVLPALMLLWPGLPFLFPVLPSAAVALGRDIVSDVPRFLIFTPYLETLRQNMNAPSAGECWQVHE